MARDFYAPPEPSKIVVLPDGTTLIVLPNDAAADEWRRAIFGQTQDAKGNRTIVAVSADPFIVTDLRR